MNSAEKNISHHRSDLKMNSLYFGKGSFCVNVANFRKMLEVDRIT